MQIVRVTFMRDVADIFASDHSGDELKTVSVFSRPDGSYRAIARVGDIMREKIYTYESYINFDEKKLAELYIDVMGG